MTRLSRSLTPAFDATSQKRGALLGLGLLMLGGLLLSGCNTTAGAGQDVKATGAAITQGADTVKSKM